MEHIFWRTRFISIRFFQVWNHQPQISLLWASSSQKLPPPPYYLELGTAFEESGFTFDPQLFGNYMYPSYDGFERALKIFQPMFGEILGPFSRLPLPKLDSGCTCFGQIKFLFEKGISSSFWDIPPHSMVLHPEETPPGPPFRESSPILSHTFQRGPRLKGT